jgi:hypothetical protein
LDAAEASGTANAVDITPATAASASNFFIFFSKLTKIRAPLGALT